jgi:secondary thiamine-phosphate synthase enzyme
MPVRTQTYSIPTSGKGMYEITYLVEAALESSGQTEGVAVVFCRHTSASLVLMENADPTAKSDLESWLDRHIPEGDPNYNHNAEGADDMPAHIKTAITRSSETIPFLAGRLLLGAWQGIFLWEHRNVAHSREIVVTIIGGSDASSF